VLSYWSKCSCWKGNVIKCSETFYWRHEKCLIIDRPCVSTKVDTRLELKDLASRTVAELTKGSHSKDTDETYVIYNECEGQKRQDTRKRRDVTSFRRLKKLVSLGLSGRSAQGSYRGGFSRTSTPIPSPTHSVKIKHGYPNLNYGSYLSCGVVSSSQFQTGDIRAFWPCRVRLLRVLSFN
jgi:hypothetical protein